MDTVKRVLSLDHNQSSTGELMAKIVAGWTAVFAGLSLGDLATLAALIYTVLNIVFLLYDRLIKHRVKKEVQPVLSSEPSGTQKE